MKKYIYSFWKWQLPLFIWIAISMSSCDIKNSNEERLRVLYWNIQNGMWDGQNDDYTRFVDWIKQQNPDICVWCEAQSIYKTNTADPMEPENRYLVKNWGELAKRYGHSYWYIGGYRDNYPQVITSKYPIKEIHKITGAEPDSIVTHGAGWAQVEIKGQIINLVSLHTWPQAYAFQAEDQEKSKSEHGGDKYRRMEIEYICKHTIETIPEADTQNWIMLGDFNSRSRIDNYYYKYPENDTRFLVHDYIQEKTPYIDVIAKKSPNQFKTTTGKMARIDFVYCTPPLYKRIIEAKVITDDYTKPVRNPKNLSNFWHPSDHRPILVDFNLNEITQ